MKILPLTLKAVKMSENDVSGYKHFDFIVNNVVSGSYIRYDNQSDIDLLFELQDCLYNLARCDREMVSNYNLTCFNKI